MTETAKPTQTSQERVALLLAQEVTISPDQLHQTGAFGGRNAIYDACARGDIYCIRVGRRFFIPTAPLRKKLGLEAA
jgi:hypothetical protein